MSTKLSDEEIADLIATLKSGATVTFKPYQCKAIYDHCTALEEELKAAQARAQSPAQAEPSEAYKQVRDLVYRMAPNGEADAALMLAINKLVASAQGSVTGAIEEVKRLRDEWATGDRQSDAMVADEIMNRLSTLQGKAGVNEQGHYLPNWLWCERCQAWIETRHQCPRATSSPASVQAPQSED